MRFSQIYTLPYLQSSQHQCSCLLTRCFSRENPCGIQTSKGLKIPRNRRCPRRRRPCKSEASIECLSLRQKKIQRNRQFLSLNATETNILKLALPKHFQEILGGNDFKIFQIRYGCFGRDWICWWQTTDCVLLSMPLESQIVVVDLKSIYSMFIAFLFPSIRSSYWNFWPVCSRTGHAPHHACLNQQPNHFSVASLSSPVQSCPEHLFSADSSHSARVLEWSKLTLRKTFKAGPNLPRAWHAPEAAAPEFTSIRAAWTIK